MATLTLTGTATDDTIVINATGTDSGTYSINGGAAVAFSGVTRVVVIGEDSNDTLTIVNPDGGLFAPTGGISFDGGGDPPMGLRSWAARRTTSPTQPAPLPTLAR